MNSSADNDSHEKIKIYIRERKERWFSDLVSACLPPQNYHTDSSLIL